MEPTKQQQLILDFDGNCVVIASPGSGKTFTIAQKIKQNLSDLKSYEGVIAISYTNKASSELRGRSLFGGENPHNSFFGTIDKFCLSEIVIPFGKHIWGLPSDSFDIDKLQDLPQEESNDFQWFTREYTIEDLTNEQIELLGSRFRQGKVFIETIGLIACYVFEHSIACQKYLKARYTNLYVDEYQDSGNNQHFLFLKMKQLGIKAVAVGDLNQSIYEFSGKSSEYLESLIKNDDFKYFVLDKNHRCHSSIINYSNYLLNPKTEPLETDGYKHVYHHHVMGNEIEIAKWLGDMIPKWKKAFEVNDFNKIAILTRGSRTSGIVDDRLLIKHKLFLSNELDLNLNVWSGIFKSLLQYMLDPSCKFADVVEEYTSYEKLTRNQKVNLRKFKNSLDSFTNYEELDREECENWFIEVARIIAPEAENDESKSLLKTIFTNENELYSYRPAGPDEVCILTLHKSKGLEFDIVFHLDLVEWVFPYQRPGPNNDFSNPIYPSWKQDLNLHYVGVTRAKRACILVSSSKRTNNDGLEKSGRPSIFLSKNNVHTLRHQNK